MPEFDRQLQRPGSKIGSMTSKRKRDAPSTPRYIKIAPKPNDTAGSVAAAITPAETTSTTGLDPTALPLPHVSPGHWADMALDITRYEGKPSNAMEALAQMTAVREPVWRYTYNPVESFNLSRSINWEALQVQCTGAVTAFPCEHCRRGKGPWAQCVMLRGSLGVAARIAITTVKVLTVASAPAKAAEENTAPAASAMTASSAPSNAPAAVRSATASTRYATRLATAIESLKRAKSLDRMHQTTAIPCNVAAAAVAPAASAMTASPAPSNAPAAVPSAATSTPYATRRATAIDSLKQAKRLDRMYRTTASACNAAAAALTSAASVMSYLAEELADEAGIHGNVD